MALALWIPMELDDSMATSVEETVWFGTDTDGLGLWNGRIDELALFDKALSDKNIAKIYLTTREDLTAREETASQQ
ncbi:hypothetical protein CA13_17000 [Planctomycetes bacterium CA13]|uniref:LamG-like jellyroll fold domain-containing protein n=1 Tax=Novipirellula herctigrandis TaxID=2527986 RepID=A0A5C5Z0B9_9BACT|nr:hypothetical protein CA13_17000 [Planctomycetes bacterium CA13]